MSTNSNEQIIAQDSNFSNPDPTPYINDNPWPPLARDLRDGEALTPSLLITPSSTTAFGPRGLLQPDLMGLQRLLPELFSLRQWVAWRAEWNAERGTYRKAPISPVTGGGADTTDLATWGSYAQAQQYYLDHAGDMSLGGIGFVFARGGGYIGIDIDHCLTLPDGNEPDAGGLSGDDLSDLIEMLETDQRARQIIEALGSYAEISPSLGGVKMIVRASDITLALSKAKDKETGVEYELYNEGRFFALTGCPWSAAPAHNAIAENREAVLALYQELFGERAKRNSEPPVYGRCVRSDEEVIAIMVAQADPDRQRNLPNWGKELYQGDWRAITHDHSQADHILCMELAFIAKNDPKAMDRVFRRSVLMRDKWDKKNGTGTYGSRTIDNAIRANVEKQKTKKDKKNGVTSATPPNTVPSTGGAGAAAAANGVPPIPVSVSVAEAAAAVASVTVEEKPWCYTWGELESLKLEIGEEIIFGLERGEIAGLNAITNIGKSTLLRNLAICLATGRAFAPIVSEGKKRKVLILDFETRLARLRQDITTMLSIDELLDEELQQSVRENLLLASDARFGDEPLTLSNPQHLAYVRHLALAAKVDVIIVDTISAGFDVRDENSNAEITGRVMKPLAALAADTNSAVIYAHHIGKPKTEEGQSSEAAYRGRGASAFGAWPALVLNLMPDSSVPGRVVLSYPKIKRENVPDDTRFDLDRAARWFASGAKVIPQPRTAYLQLLALFESGREMNTSEATTALTGIVQQRQVKSYLAQGVREGDLSQPKHGRYKATEQGEKAISAFKAASTTPAARAAERENLPG